MFSNNFVRQKKFKSYNTGTVKKTPKTKEQEPIILYDTFGSRNIESQFDNKQEMFNVQEFEYKKKKRRRLPGIKLLRELEKDTEKKISTRDDTALLSYDDFIDSLEKLL